MITSLPDKSFLILIPADMALYLVGAQPASGFREGVMEQDDKELILVNKYWCKTTPEGRLSFIVGILGWLTILPIILLPLYSLFLKADKFRGNLPAQLLHTIKADPSNILLLIAMLGYLIFLPVYQRQASKTERLILSAQGIRYISPLSGLLKRFKPDWSLAWSQVSKIEIVIMSPLVRNPDLIGLTLTAGLNKHKIIPVRWINPENYARPGLRAGFQFFKLKSHAEDIDDIKRAVKATEAARYIAENVNIPIIDAQLNKITTPESLEQDPYGRVAAFLVILLLGYAIIDIMLGPESYVNDPLDNLKLYVAAGIIGTILSGLWISRSELSTGTKAGLALFIGIMIGVAMVPGALRINTALDKNASATHGYRVIQGDDGVVLQPLEPGWPEINYFAKDKYWEKFGKDDVYPVQVRKGALGFYQFNSAAIVKDIKQAH